MNSEDRDSNDAVLSFPPIINGDHTRYHIKAPVLVRQLRRLIKVPLREPVWKSTSASGAGTGIATPSSRCRVDGVEVDAAIQDDRAVKF